MKILNVIPGDLGRDCASREIAFGLHEALLRMGHKSHIVAPTPSIEFVTNYRNIHFFGSRVSLQVNQSTNDLDIESFQAHSDLIEFLLKEKFDVICLQEPITPFLNWDVLAHSKSINIGWFHATTVFDVNSFPYNLFLDPITDWLNKRMHGVIAVSPSVKKTWPKVFDNRGTIIPVGVSIKKFAHAKKIKLSNCTNVLFVGRLDKRKGIFDAIESIYYASKSIDVRLYVVGDGRLRNKAVEKAKELGISSKINFEGKVSRMMLPSYYRSCDIFLAPATRGESLGIVLLEAMAAQAPIIAYANPGYRSTLKGHVWKDSLIKVGDTKSMGRAICELANNSVIRKKIIDWQNVKVKKYDWDEVTKLFLRYAEDVLIDNNNI